MSIIDTLRREQYHELELSGTGDGGATELAYRRGWNEAIRRCLGLLRVEAFKQCANDNISFDDAPTGEFITPTIATRNATPEQCAECRTGPGEFHASECEWSQVLPASGEGV